MGQYHAVSDSARVVTGSLSIERGGLIFDKGATLFTRVLNPRSGADPIARDGQTYAIAAVGSSDLRIELRRVTQQSLTRGAKALCEGAEPTYVALAYKSRMTNVTMLVFSGEEAPGPNATQSAVCATYAYAAPDGARTREGIVLQ